MTLFLWTPKIGELTETKDPKIHNYYKQNMDNLHADDDFMPDFTSTPQIAG